MTTVEANRNVTSGIAPRAAPPNAVSNNPTSSAGMRPTRAIRSEPGTATIVDHNGSSPAFAQSLYQRDGTDANRHVVRQHVEPTLRKNGRGAYGMTAAPSSQLDRYSPVLNGGGSFGYNEKLQRGF